MRQLARCSVVMFSATLALAAMGCDCAGPPAPCAPGAEGCPCVDGTRCSTGLECRDGRCLEPGAPPMDGGSRPDGGLTPARDAGPPPVAPNPDAFWEDDPPPRQCLEDGSMGPLPDPPGGTPECPDDRNREGCRCPEVGATAPCWPGRRVNRNRGICRDGVTTCEALDEFSGVWGACRGFVSPTEGALRGAGACRCFSEGRWEIDNLSPCFVTNASGQVTYTISTDPATGRCPPASATVPSAAPWPTWSDDRLRVDCEGRFELCYTLRAGDAEAPASSDCVLARVCTGSFWYAERDVVQEVPPLPSWVSASNDCAEQFRSRGGYGEMSVLGLSVECDAIDDGSGSEYVFNRVDYCPLYCNTEPTRPECERCGRGGMGVF